jgi:hypothetical protein
MRVLIWLSRECPCGVISGWLEMFALHERDRVEAVISKSHVCISDFVALRLCPGSEVLQDGEVGELPG